MRTDIDTQRINPVGRLTFWREAVCANLVGVECDAGRKQTLKGRFTQIAHDGYAIARLRAEAHSAIRENAMLRRSDTDFYMLFLQKTGTMRVQRDGRDFRVQPGDMYFYDGRTEHHLIFDEAFDHLAVKVPRKVLETRWSRLAEIGSFRTSGEQSVVDHVLMPMAGAALGSPSGNDLPLVASALLDLFAARVQSDLPEDENASRYARLTLRRIRSFIDARIDCSDLGVDDVAQEFRISRRQVDRILAQCGTSFSRTLSGIRMARAAEILEQTWSVAHSITEIALMVGFENHSHFSRKFREAYGVSPTEYRSNPIRRHSV